MGIGYKADYNFVSVAFKTATKKKKISPPSNEYEKQGLSKTVLTRRKRISNPNSPRYQITTESKHFKKQTNK